MARYYFDVQNGDNFHRDTHGGECDGFAAIRTEAMHMLPELASRRFPTMGTGRRSPFLFAMTAT